MVKKIDLDELVPGIARPFIPKHIANVDGTMVQLVRIEGAYRGHTHPGRAEMFIVFRGSMAVHVDGEVIPLREGQCLMVPGDVPHYSFAEKPAFVLVLAAGDIETKDIDQ